MQGCGKDCNRIQQVLGLRIPGFGFGVLPCWTQGVLAFRVDGKMCLRPWFRASGHFFCQDYNTALAIESCEEPMLGCGALAPHNQNRRVLQTLNPEPKSRNAATGVGFWGLGV